MVYPKLRPDTSAVEAADILTTAFLERDPQGESYIPIGTGARAVARAHALNDLARLRVINHRNETEPWTATEDARVRLNQLFHPFITRELGRDERTLDAWRDAAAAGDEARARTAIDGAVYRFLQVSPFHP